MCPWTKACRSTRETTGEASPSRKKVSTIFKTHQMQTVQNQKEHMAEAKEERAHPETVEEEMELAGDKRAKSRTNERKVGVTMLEAVALTGEFKTGGWDHQQGLMMDKVGEDEEA